ncbi:MAG TPA: hypothetical protein VNY84_11105, partial [Acidimicrobiales bacterium]|nr:hypothetical protein [Acidimicrobiales bacterium]
MSALLRPAAVGGLALGLAAAGLAGLPGLDVGAVAAAGWIAGGGAGAALARRRRDALPAGAPTSASAERPNPYAVPQPWRDLVADVLRAQQKFAETAAAGAPGPLQSRLLSLASRLDDGVRESWLVALRGAALNEAITR